MNKMFVHALSPAGVRLSGQQKKMLPRSVSLVSTVQHSHLLPHLKRQLPGATIGGTVLGCDFAGAIRKTGCYLFVGTGMFHPLMLAFKSGKPVFILNPHDGIISKVDDAELELLRKKKKACYVRFLHSKTVGIIVSMKPGQEHLKKAFALQKKLPKSYVFLSDNIDVNALQNFPFVESFVNTACPRLVEDSSLPMVNLEDI